MDKLRSILVGVDFTPGSAASLRQASRLAQATGNAMVRAVHVINTHVVIDLQHALSPMQKTIQASLEAEAKRAWTKFEQEIVGHHTAELVIRVGNPTSAILDEVDAVAADLLVLGVHRDEDSHEGAGMVAGACVRKAKSRVLLVRPEQSGPFKRVAACVDFSEVSRSAVIEGARVARLEGAALDIVHVFEPAWRQLSYFGSMSENSPKLQADSRAQILAKLQQFCEPLKSELAGLPHEFKIEEHRSAGRGIIEYAKKNNVELIVLGTQGRSNLRDVLLGSTAERVLRLTPCSMLTVRE